MHISVEHEHILRGFFVPTHHPMYTIYKFKAHVLVPMNFYIQCPRTLAYNYCMPETLSNHHLPFLKPTQRTLLETYKLGVPFQGVMDIVSVIHQSLYVGEGCYSNEDDLLTLWLGFHSRSSIMWA